MENVQPNTGLGESLIKHAFLNQYNLILLGGMALFALASGSVAPLLLAAVGELVWLLVGAQSAWFKSWVGGQGRLREEQSWRNKVEATATGIDPNAAARLRLMGGALLEVALLTGERNQPEFSAAVNVRLDSLLQSYAALAAAHQRLVRLMGAGGSDVVEAEIIRLSRALAEEKDATVRISLRQAVALSQRRLKRFEQVETLGRDLAVKMSTFESSVEFVRAELGGGEPEGEVLAALDEIQGAARFNPEYEAEATRALGDRRTISGMYPLPRQSESQ